MTTDHTREALAETIASTRVKVIGDALIYADENDTMALDSAPFDADTYAIGDAILASPWLAAQVAAAVDVAVAAERERIGAAIGLVQPDHLTPMGARIIEQALGGDTDE